MRPYAVVDAFRRACAVSPSSARPLEDLGIEDERAVGRLRSQAAVREASPGSYYLDEQAWAAVHRRRHRPLVVALALTLLALLVALLFLARRQEH